MPRWWAEQSLGATRLPPRLRRRGPHSQRPALRTIPSAHSNFLPRFPAQAGNGVGGSHRNPVPRGGVLKGRPNNQVGGREGRQGLPALLVWETECSQGASDSGRCRPEAPGRWSHQRAGRIRRGCAHGANPAVRMLSPPLLYISSGSEHEVEQGGMAESGVASGHPVMPGPSRLALLPPASSPEARIHPALHLQHTALLFLHDGGGRGSYICTEHSGIMVQAARSGLRPNMKSTQHVFIRAVSPNHTQSIG